MRRSGGAVDEAGCPVGRGCCGVGGWVRAGLVGLRELIGLDEAVSLGIAGAVLAVLLAVAAWWAPRNVGNGGEDGAGREQASPAREKSGTVTNAISGGTFSGPVVQGRDFTGLTFGASADPPARPEDPDAT